MKNKILYSTKVSTILRSFASWTLQMLRAPLVNTSAYLVTRPRPFRTQTIINKTTKNKIIVRVESEIDYYVLEQIFVKEHYSLRSNPLWTKISDCYNHLVTAPHSPPLIVDCGANIGLSVRYFCDQYPDARIIALEPSARNFAIARDNLKNINKATLHHAAIGSELGYCEIQDPVEATWAIRVAGTSDGTIPVLTVQELLSQVNGCLTPFIIKIDIEGSEKDLFSKNTDWMQTFPIIIIELHDWISPGALISQSFLRAISALDRDFYHNEENIISISVPLLNELARR